MTQKYRFDWGEWIWAGCMLSGYTAGTAETVEIECNRTLSAPSFAQTDGSTFKNWSLLDSTLVDNQFQGAILFRKVKKKKNLHHVLYAHPEGATPPCPPMDYSLNDDVTPQWRHELVAPWRHKDHNGFGLVNTILSQITGIKTRKRTVSVIQSVHQTWMANR